MKFGWKILAITALLLTLAAGGIILTKNNQTVTDLTSQTSQSSQLNLSNLSPSPANQSETKMKLTSSAFENNQQIPSKFTCDDQNINPPLSISEIPANTVSLALIIDDPDAPAGTWVHWTLWNIDPKTGTITENSIPTDATEGTTSFGKPGYGGPCPPSGTHHYYFKLYAIDTKLDLSPTSTKQDLKNAMEGHILAQTELVGLYQRK